MSEANDVDATAPDTGDAANPDTEDATATGGRRDTIQIPDARSRNNTVINKTSISSQSSRKHSHPGSPVIANFPMNIFGDSDTDVELPDLDDDDNQTRRYDLSPNQMDSFLENLAKKAESLVSAIETPPLVPKFDHSVYITIVETIKTDMSKKTVMRNINDIWELYEETRSKLEKQDHLLEKTRTLAKQLEEEVRKNPKVKQAIWYAGEHRRENQQLEAKNEELEQELEDCSHEVEHLKANLKETEKKLLTERGARRIAAERQHRERDPDVKTEVSEAKTAIEYEEEIESLKVEIKETNLWRTQMKKKIADIHRQEQLQHQHEQMLSEKDNLISEMDSQLSKLQRIPGDTTFGKSLENKMKTNQYYKKLLSDCIARVEQLEIEKKRTRYLMSKSSRVVTGSVGGQKAKDVLEEKLKLSAKENQELRRVVEAKEKELHQVQLELSAAVGKLKICNVTTSKLEDQHTIQATQIQEYLIQRDIDKRDIDMLQADINTRIRHIDTLASRCDFMAQKLSEKRGTIIRHVHDKNVLKLAELAANKTNQMLVNYISDQRNFLARQAEKIDGLRTLLLEVREKEEKCEDDRKRLNQYGNVLERKLDKLQHQHDLSEMKTIMCQKKNAATLVELSILNDTFHDTKQNLNVQKHEIEYHSGEVLRKELVIQRQNMNASILMDKLTTKTAKCSQLENDLREKARDMNSLHEDFCNINKALDHTKQQLKDALISYREMKKSRDQEATTTCMLKAQLGMLEQRMLQSESTLKDGRAVLVNRHNDVRTLVLEVKSLRGKLKCHTLLEERHHTLMEEHNTLHRNFLHCQAKLTALESMKPIMENPKRKLKAVNYSAYELQLKAAALTKRLIRKTIEVTEKEQLLMKKNQLFLELKMLLYRRGDAGLLHEELNDVKRKLFSSNRQVKSLKADLSTCQYELSQAVAQARGAQEKLSDTRKDLLTQKKLTNSLKLQGASKPCQEKKENDLSLPPLNNQFRGKKIHFQKNTLRS